VIDQNATEAFVSERVSTLRVHAAEVSVLQGPDAGRSMRIEHPTFVIGTGPGADLRLTDSSVSREHLRVSLVSDGIRLRDEGSKNGTFLGKIRVFDTIISESSTIQIGRTTVSIRIDAGQIDLPLSEAVSFGGAIGVSAPMRHLFALLERAAASDVTILLEGESGVGKEVLANAIHTASARADGPFVAVDCGAIPPNLIESELFGHVRGAFTGAANARDGVFEQARGGTLFLDEIGELPLDLQPKLLRVIEQREVRPVGSNTPHPVDVRIVAATNRRLAEAAQKNEFRSDLFYRLAVARATVPPLRDRPDDILPLARAFLHSLTKGERSDVAPELASLLTSYPWPGNVRELRNVMARYALLDARDALTLFDSPTANGSLDLSHLPLREARRIALERFEQDYVPRVLARADGVVSRAAQLAEVARPSFYRMLERLRLDDDGNEKS
jgi:transcriptional regulator with PAS, ATPase and Fis domain